MMKKLSKNEIILILVITNIITLFAVNAWADKAKDLQMQVIELSEKIRG